MKDKSSLIEVIIPIYKANLSVLELKSLQQVYSVLGKYPLVIVKPESLDVSDLLKRFPSIKVKSFENQYFNGISGYNKLMLSETFYSEFLHSKYILIYQLDAYIFEDKLTYWCEKDYDYIGAPWLKKPIYNLPVISGIMTLCRIYDRLKGVKNKQELYNKIGNGGFSLRKVDSHYEIVTKQQERVRFFLERKHHLYNEDVFWATVASFNYPEVTEAIDFAFDKYPSLCYKLNNKKLPFGCHGWYKRKMKSFWKPIIGF